MNNVDIKELTRNLFTKDDFERAKLLFKKLEDVLNDAEFLPGQNYTLPQAVLALTMLLQAVVEHAQPVQAQNTIRVWIISQMASENVKMFVATEP